MDRRPFERDRGYGGVGNFPQNGFNPPQGMMNPYGGMTPALMAQWYQRMQAYYATMGRGMIPGMGMGAPMMGMPNMNMQGMGMGGIPNMGGQMMGIGQGMNQGMGGYQTGIPMNQGYASPNQQQQHQQYQQESSSHEGEYTYDTSSDQVPPPAQHSPSNNGGDIPSGPREGPPPNAPTGPSGLKPNYVGGPRGRGMMRGVGRGYGGGSFPGGMARGGNVRYNPYAR
jgi:RNA-binding protein Musashi